MPELTKWICPNCRGIDCWYRLPQLLFGEVFIPGEWLCSRCHPKPVEENASNTSASITCIPSDIAPGEYDELKRELVGEADKRQYLKQYSTDGYAVTNGWSHDKTQN